MGETADVVKRAVRLMDEQDVDGMREVLDEDIELDSGGTVLHGVDEIKALLDYFTGVFPDLAHEVVDFVEDGDKVAMRFKITGTHTGTFVSEYGEFPPTGEKLTWISSAFVTLMDGRPHRWVLYLDALALHRAVGMAPPALAH
jgi:predicted ester cyclase